MIIRHGTFAFSVMLAALPIHSPLAQTYGDWRVGFGQGILEHRVMKGPGNTINISCDVGATENGSKTSVLIDIAGQSPPINSSAKFFIGDRDLQIYFDAQSQSTLNCRACQANFEELWRAMRRASAVRVLLSDGRTANFSTRGGSRALASKPCKTGL
jgi:hypothetical protein